MKAILSALVFTVLATASASAEEPAAMALHEEPQALPELVVADEAGERRSLED